MGHKLQIYVKWMQKDHRERGIGSRLYVWPSDEQSVLKHPFKQNDSPFVCKK